MFTGIVEETGEVLETRRDDAGRRVRIGTSFAGDLHRGQSLSVSGVCLTVEALDPESVEVFLAAETLSRTYFDQLDPGDHVNLERALTPADRLDGHIVQGHVDGTGEVRARRPVDSTDSPSPTGNAAENTHPSDTGGDWEFAVSIPSTLKRYVVEKGSIAVDGISLTVAAVDDRGFTVAVIPTTYHRTTLSEKSVGDPVHLEVDILAKYVERLHDGQAESR